MPPTGTRNKRHSALRLEFTSPEAANRAFWEGVYWNAELMTSRRGYVREARVVQCYKCQMYGHVAAKCQNSNSICSTCAGHHRAETCDKKKDRTAWRCPACARDGHRSTDHSCPARKQASREANAKQRALEHQPNPVKTRTPASSILGRSQDGEGPRCDTTPGPGTTRRNPRKRTAVSPPGRTTLPPRPSLYRLDWSWKRRTPASLKKAARVPTSLKSPPAAVGTLYQHAERPKQ